MELFKIGDEVVRTKGDYVVGRTGKILAVDAVKNRAQVDWENETTTWVSFGSLALTSTPYEIIPAKYDNRGRRTSYAKYKRAHLAHPLPTQ